ncbi:TPA: hypothetical protein GXZ54_01420 [bacterium]|jgi:hypothetical protein|nr:hypothetical protein [bacterium]
MLVNQDFISHLINFFVGGLCILNGYFAIKYESLKILSGYNEHSMPYIDKKLLSRFIGTCLINAGCVVIIPNIIAYFIFPDLSFIVGIISYVIFGIIILFMIIVTNKEGKKGGKFTKKE